MDLVDGFRVFVASVETRSFSGAAARLGMSPKLASKYMAELEAQLGTQLLHRTTRRLGLTAAGEQLLSRAPDWLNELDEMTGELREALRGLSGTLRISAPVTYGELRVLPVARQPSCPRPTTILAGFEAAGIGVFRGFLLSYLLCPGCRCWLSLAFGSAPACWWRLRAAGSFRRSSPRSPRGGPACRWRRRSSPCRGRSGPSR